METEDIVYTPRPQKKVLQSLAEGKIPIEIKEQYQLIDIIPQPIKQKVTAIIERIVKANQLAGERYQLNLQISAEKKENASIITSAKQPVLILTQGLLANVKSEDELAGIIAHEFGHLILHETAKEADHHNKIEEVAADNLGVKLIAKAGYDPRAIIYFLRRAGNSDAHLISMDDLAQDLSIDALEEKVRMLQRLADPHPADDNRIRCMETTITTLVRSGNSNDFTKPLTELPENFIASVSPINYNSPLATGMQNCAYQDKSILEKMSLLTELLTALYPVTSQAAEKRLQELAPYIELLEVDFSNQQQKEGFYKLTDVVLTKYPEEKNQASYNILKLITAMNKVWEQGGNPPTYLARFQDLKNAQDQFINAQTAQEAEDAALVILGLSDKLNLSWYLKSKPFKVALESEINEALTTTGTFKPEYNKHLAWYRQTKSQNIKKVLVAMELTNDPLVKDLLGDYAPEDGESIWRMQTQLIPVNQSMYAINKKESYYAYFKQFERTEDGTVTGIQIRIPAFRWEILLPKSNRERIIAHHTTAMEEKRKYEEQILPDIDWSLLRKDFPQFINRYGLLLKQNYSLAPGISPFSEKFYEVLTEELLQTNRHNLAFDYPSPSKNPFLAQVLNFFSIDSAPNSLTSFRYNEVYPMMELHLNLSTIWPYKQVSRPALFKPSDPVIRFLLNQQLASLIPDDLKIEFSLKTAGIWNADPTKKIAEQSTVDWKKKLAYYPENITNIEDLKRADTQYLYLNGPKKYSDLAILLELERITYEQQDTITYKDYLEVSRLYRNCCFILEDDYQKKFELFIQELNLRTLQKAVASNDASALINNYRLAVGHEHLDLLPEIRKAFYAQIKCVVGNLPNDEKCKYLRKLFKIKDVQLGATYPSNAVYKGYIPDPEFRNWAVENYTDALAIKLGQDDSSPNYFNAARASIDDISKNTSGLTQLNILNALANKTNAQKDVSIYIRDIANQHALEKALSQRSDDMLIELFNNQCSKDEILRNRLIDFLTNPLTPNSTKPLLEWVDHKRLLYYVRFNNQAQQKESFEKALRDYHLNFRSATLEVKTVYLETLLFPIGSSKQQQNENINRLISAIFPIGPATGTNKDNELAQLIVKSYLDVTEFNERRLLAAALFVANIKEEGAQELSTGKKLNLVISNMGPAGGKLLQAIHSHPQTPENIKADLAGAKTQFGQPYRWDLVELVDNSGLLVQTESNPNPVRTIGKIVGSGSFGITVFNTLQDGSLVADTFLRENAANQAQREFRLMHKAAENIVEQKPTMQPVLNMIEEGQRSAVAETDMSLAQTANQLAEQAYQRFHLIQVGDFQFTHQVAKFLGRGEAFKRIEIANGAHFNDLENSEYKTAVAKAMIISQVSLRLAGINTDLDRHGGNIKVEGSVITHFDFGAMNLEPITAEDKIITGKVLAQALYAVAKNGENFSDALLLSIQNANVSPQSRNYLNGLNKDFLALGDYINVLNADDLPALLAYCLTAKTVDPQIKAAFKEKLGLFAHVVEPYLQWKAKEAGIKLVSKQVTTIESTSRETKAVIEGKPSQTGLFATEFAAKKDELISLRSVTAMGA